MLTKMMQEFNSTYNVNTTTVDRTEARKAYFLAHEEMTETFKEVDLGKATFVPTDTIKEMGDVIYVLAQQMVTMGVDVDAVLAEIHRSNMSKTVSKDIALQELDIALERYPDAYIDTKEDCAVLRCEATGKVIKSSTYSPAVITDEMIGL